MNRLSIVAWINDWQISVKLAKISELYSFDLYFFEDISQLLKIDTKILMIIDKKNVNLKKLDEIKKLKNNKYIFILAYKSDLEKTNKSEYSINGYDMILNKKNLLKNIESIIKQVANAS